MTKAKKPINVSVTAAMAASRAGPNFVTSSRTDFTTRRTHPNRSDGRAALTRQNLPRPWLAFG